MKKHVCYFGKNLTGHYLNALDIWEWNNIEYYVTRRHDIHIASDNQECSGYCLGLDNSAPIVLIFNFVSVWI